MKKLIAILSATILVYSTALVIITCGSAKSPQSGGTGGSRIDKQLLKKVLSDDGIDGSMFNTKNTEAEVLSLIKQEIIKIEATATNIKFENANEENITLCEGVNHFKVSFDAKSEHLIYSVIVKNIKNINYSGDNEIGIFINTILEDEDLLEVEYKDEDLDVDDVTKWKKFIGQKIHGKLPNATVNIEKTNGLKHGEVNVIIEVGNLPDGIQNITKQIVYVSEKASRTNSNEKPNLKNFDDIVREIGKWSYDNNTFTLHNKARKEATFFFEKEITNFFKDNGLNAPQFMNGIDDMIMERGKSLNEGTNKIKIRIKNPQTNKFADVVITLNDVKPASKLKVLKEVKTNYGGEKKFKQSTPTYEHIVSIYQKWLDSRSGNGKIIISLKDPNKLNQKLSEGTNFIAVNYSENDKTISGIIKPVLTISPDNGSAFNVPGDGSCLFWSYATAYLLPVRNDNEELKTRFQELFGKDQLTKLMHIQNLLKEFNLKSNATNQPFYNDEVVKELVKKIFRNKVVDYIEKILSTNNDEKKAILITAIQVADGIDNENVDINDYLQKMRKESTWVGNVEIMAMTYMFNCFIIVVNENNSDDTEFQPLNKIPKSEVKLFHRGVHYNFYLPSKIE